MTHEEMAQRIGSSRETVTRLLSHLKKKRLIRIEGTTLVIRDRTGLEALAVEPSPLEAGGKLGRPPNFMLDRSGPFEVEQEVSSICILAR